MNLARHAAVLWRFKAVTAAGLILGVVLAGLASYKVTMDGGPKLQARGTSTWTSQSSVLVTQAGFPEGRVVLPDLPTQKANADGTLPPVPDNEIAFADPARFNTLADLYSQLATSDRIRRRIPERPKPGEITASPVPAQSGASILPVITLTTQAETAPGARALNLHTVEALRELLTVQQDKNEIPANQRVTLSLLNRPSTPTLLKGPSHTASVLALLLCLIGTIAVTHLLANLRDREAVDTLVVPWAGDAAGPYEVAEHRSAPVGAGTVPPGHQRAQ
jgi:hypothetical protein